MSGFSCNYESDHYSSSHDYYHSGCDYYQRDSYHFSYESCHYKEDYSGCDNRESHDWCNKDDNDCFKHDDHYRHEDEHDSNWYDQHHENCVCFLSGTLIATPDGEVAVETLKRGDRVLTADGRAVAIRFMGRQTVATRFGPAERLCPVLIRAGALGENLPHTDLTVTTGHGMILDGIIAHAHTLVNGVSIVRLDPAEVGDRYVVWSIETEDHEVLVANGAAAESFADHVSRSAFDNYDECVALFGTESRPMKLLDMPLAQNRRQVPPAIRARLDERAACLAAEQGQRRAA